VAWHECGRVQPGLFACNADDQEEAVGFVCNFVLVLRLDVYSRMVHYLPLVRKYCIGF
jgi:hypothetical protein